MATTPNDRQADAMEREVNRLLAQLAHAGAEPIGERRPGIGIAVPPPVSRPRTSGPRRTVAGGAGRSLAALWGRLVLVGGLGAGMTQWPYQHACGWPLLGYLGAVATLLLAGGWVAFASWRVRSGVTLVVSLILFYWGLVLAAEQVLPRVGYAAEEAGWLCGEAGSP